MQDEQQQEPQPAQQPPVVTPIDVQHGALVPKDSSELNRTLANIAAGGGFPARFDTPQKRIAAYNLAHSLTGGKWQLAINHMANIKGQLSIYGELPGDLAERTKEVSEKHVYLIDSNYKMICTENRNLDEEPIAAVCKIQRKGRALKEFSYTVKDAYKAGQLPAKADSAWSKHFKTMLMRKAMALGIKFEFPDAILGTPIAEYDFDEAPDLKDVTPKKGIDSATQSVSDLIQDATQEFSEDEKSAILAEEMRMAKQQGG